MPGEVIQTVLGPVSLKKLGKTLTHEHLTIDFTEFYTPPPAGVQKHLDDKITLRNVWFIQRYPYSNKYNLTLNDADSEEAVIGDVKSFYESGGRTILDNSSHGLKRRIPFLKKVSEVADVNIIIGTGYYVAGVQNATTLNMTKEQMYETMYKEIEEDYTGYPGIKAGFIGEVGSSWPIEDFEKRAICATGELQAQLRCPVSFHPGRHPDAPGEILRIYQEAGGNDRRAVMSHLERTVRRADIKSFARNHRCYCQFDLFGTQCGFYQLNPSFNMPSDEERIDIIQMLRDDKLLERILLSHDIHTKHRLTRFGGHGYAHIENNILPVMFNKGFTKKELQLLTVDNPKAWLTPS